MKKTALIVFTLLITSLSFAQNEQKDDTDLKPYRIGLKIGTPLLAGLDLEYVTPLLNNRVAPFANFSIAGYKPDDENEFKFSTFEIGTNIYFNDKGQGTGLYGAVSYQNMNIKLDQQNYEDSEGNTYEGTASSKIKYNAVNLKIGAKLGKKFYFRTELGYSFGSIPQEVVVTGILNGTQVTETTDISEDIEDISIIKNGIPIFNLGFGFSF